ncbi:MAG: dTDP-4-dehydrorhamnose reductase [Porphyromonadaceae bacterium]|nr:dTDP-4-dehydrorhamnose reductase [Porphyromonadaceae bacterium]
MSTILVTGANGQLGNEMRNKARVDTANHYLFTDVQELDITDLCAIQRFLAENPIDFLVNCAAYTAVDKAESDIELCRKINALAVENLAKATVAVQAKMIHISTDYVYSGKHFMPYVESDVVAPSSVYGVTKLEGEQSLAAANPQSVILRTSWLYSPYGNNFVKTMLRLGKERTTLSVVSDQVGTPTYAEDLATAIVTIIHSDRFIPGIYNFSDEGVCSWYDFAVTIHRMAGITSCRVSPIRTVDYPSAATRPFYSVMNKKKIKDTYSLEIPHWEESLQRCIARLQEQD